ncbi:MAG: polymer-forming cytoskeletal protein [Akkermansia sp.]|nr:polymer-forming cytoskeletal protein [Akkermansia sp.]MDO4818555.1 polymer-forming cytoskeletal protein [Akkermansia sp.]
MFKYPKQNDDKFSNDSPFNDVPADWATKQDDAPASSPFGSKTDSSDSSPSPFEQVNTASLPASASRNVLNQDVEVVGILRFKDDLLVDGSVQGRIESDGVLTVGGNAYIKAGEKEKSAVQTKSVIVHGRVHGDIEVTDRVELAATAEVIGNISANKISVQEGAILVGQCRIGAPASMPAAAPAKAKAATPVASKTPNLLG